MQITIKGAAEAETRHAIAIDEAHRMEAGRADYLREVASRTGLFVAYADASPAGFSCLDQRCFFRRPFLSLLIVHPEHRRKGIGEALLKHAQSEIGGKRLFTSTNLSNAPMIALLAKCRFVLCGHVAGLDDGDPELVFSKDP